MSGYEIAHVNDIPELDDGRVPMRPVRHHLGITAFGVNAWTAHAAGDRIINEHDEAGGDEELYVVTQGRAVFEIDGERVEAPAGSLVYVRPEARRTAIGEEAGTTIVAVGATPGKAYEPVGWELWSPLRHLYEEGKYDEVVARGRELIAEHPDSSLVYYNLACCESLAGEPGPALEHLRRSIELSERFREYAKGDSDFDAVRDEPEFKELVGG
jgi:tetratricopeptide (TPR) repeat protein